MCLFEVLNIVFSGRPLSMHSMCTVYVYVCMCICVGWTVVSRACYDLTGQDHWSEMQDGILWWAVRVWINMADFNSRLSTQVWVCVSASVCAHVRDHQACLCCVHWSLLLKPSWIFLLLKYAVFRLRCRPPTPMLTSQLYLFLLCWIFLQTSSLIPSYFQLHLHSSCHHFLT